MKMQEGNPSKEVNASPIGFQADWWAKKKKKIIPSSAEMQREESSREIPSVTKYALFESAVPQFQVLI